MTTTISTPTRFVLGTVFALSGVFAIGLPSFAHAATYAFVNTSGEVSAVVANDPMTAINTALNRAIHSGVMLLVNPFDSILGFKVNPQ